MKTTEYQSSVFKTGDPRAASRMTHSASITYAKVRWRQNPIRGTLVCWHCCCCVSGQPIPSLCHA